MYITESKTREGVLTDHFERGDANWGVFHGRLIKSTPAVGVSPRLWLLNTVASEDLCTVR